MKWIRMLYHSYLLRFYYSVAVKCQVKNEVLFFRFLVPVARLLGKFGIFSAHSSPKCPLLTFSKKEASSESSS